MAGVLVDSNILIDLFSEHNTWYDWSSRQLQDCATLFQLIINPIIYSEISYRFSRAADLEDVLGNANIVKEEIPWDAAFIAAKVHMKYRRQGGSRESTLPDFFIGAHALVADYALLTRDEKRYHTYFPTVKLLCP